MIFTTISGHANDVCGVPADFAFQKVEVMKDLLDINIVLANDLHTTVIRTSWDNTIV